MFKIPSLKEISSMFEDRDYPSIIVFLISFFCYIGAAWHAFYQNDNWKLLFVIGVSFSLTGWFLVRPLGMLRIKNNREKAFQTLKGKIKDSIKSRKEIVAKYTQLAVNIDSLKNNMGFDKENDATLKQAIKSLHSDGFLKKDEKHDEFYYG